MRLHLFRLLFVLVRSCDFSRSVLLLSSADFSLLSDLCVLSVSVLQVLLASSFVPLYAGVKPVEFQGQVMCCSASERLGSEPCVRVCVCVRAGMCLIHSVLLQDGQFQPVCQLAVSGCVSAV